jgi:hypothetical protein
MAENKTIQLDVETNLGSLRSQLRNAQAEVAILSEKFGATSTEAANAARKAAELKDRIADAKALTDAFNPDAKFNALSTSIGGVLNGFQAFEGALGVMGVESEDLQKTLLKVQSAMALSQGLQGLMEAKDSFIQLGSVVKNTFTAMTTAGRAFALTGIGLVVTAIGGLVYAYQSVSKEQDELNKKQDDLNKAFEKQNDAVYKESQSFVSLIEQLKATNKNSEDRKRLIKDINDTYGTTLKNLQDEKDFQNQLNTELKNYLTYQEYKYKLQANEDAIINNLKLQSKLKRDLAKDEAEYNKLVAQGALKRKETYETDDAGIRVYTGLAYANEELAGKAQILGQRISDNNQKLNDAKDRYTNYGKAALNASNQIDKLTEGGNKYVKQNDEVVKSIDKVTEKIDTSLLTQDDIEAIFTQQLIEEDKKRAESSNALLEQKKQDEEDYQKFWWQQYWDFSKAQDQRDKDEIDNQKKKNKERLDLALKYADTFGNAMGSLNGLLNTQDEERLKHVVKGSKEEEAIKRKMFERDKKLRIVQTIIDTASNVVQSVRNGGGIPTGIPFGIAAATMGAMQIAAISKTSFSSGNDNPSLNSNVPSANAQSITPQFNVAGGNQTSQLLQGLSAQPLKAYVVASDITTAQMLEQKAIKTSVL